MNFLEKSKQNLEEYKNILNETLQVSVKDGQMIAQAQKLQVQDEEMEDALIKFDNESLRDAAETSLEKEGNDNVKDKASIKQKIKKSVKKITTSGKKDLSDDETENIINSDADDIEILSRASKVSSDVKNINNSASFENFVTDVKNAFNITKSLSDSNGSSGATVTTAQELLQGAILASLANYNSNYKTKDDLIKMLPFEVKNNKIFLVSRSCEKYFLHNIEDIKNAVDDGKLGLGWLKSFLSLYFINPQGEALDYLNLITAKDSSYKILYAPGIDVKSNNEELKNLQKVLYGAGIGSKDKYIPADIYFINTKGSLSESDKNLLESLNKNIEGKEGKYKLAGNQESHIKDSVTLCNSLFEQKFAIPISLKKVQTSVDSNFKSAELHYIKNSGNTEEKEENLNKEIYKIMSVSKKGDEGEDSNDLNLRDLLAKDLGSYMRHLSNWETLYNILKGKIPDDIKVGSKHKVKKGKTEEEVEWEWKDFITYYAENNKKDLLDVLTKNENGPAIYPQGNVQIIVRAKEGTEIFHHFGNKFSRVDEDNIKYVDIRLEFRAKGIKSTEVDETGKLILFESTPWQCNVTIDNSTGAYMGGSAKEYMKQHLTAFESQQDELERQFLNYVSLIEDKNESSIIDYKKCDEFFEGWSQKLKNVGNIKNSGYQAIIGAAAFIFKLKKSDEKTLNSIIRSSFKLSQEVQDSLKIY